MRDQLSNALVAGDSSVKAVGAQAGSPRMGTTLTMAFIQWPLLYIAHVGDSRAYLSRGRQLIRLTTDHTVAQQLSESDPTLVDATSALHHMLWNSLGGNEDIPRPQVSKLTLEPGDCVLLCSDGLPKQLNDTEIAEIVASPAPLAERCAALVSRANATGGADNITVVIANAVPQS
jgi:protein phosphatase